MELLNRRGLGDVKKKKKKQKGAQRGRGINKVECSSRKSDDDLGIKLGESPRGDNR